VASPTTKTGRHDIAEILLKVALNTKNSINQSIRKHALEKIKLFFRLKNLITLVIGLYELFDPAT
jgi:hypothetical protein